METDSALVWTDGTVALDSVASVHSYFAFVVYPRHTENDYALRLHDSFQNLLVHKVRMLDNIWGNAFKYFFNCLVEFFLTRIPGDQICHESVYILLSKLIHNSFVLGF